MNPTKTKWVPSPMDISLSVEIPFSRFPIRRQVRIVSEGNSIRYYFVLESIERCDGNKNRSSGHSSVGALCTKAILGAVLGAMLGRIVVGECTFISATNVSRSRTGKR